MTPSMTTLCHNAECPYAGCHVLFDVLFYSILCSIIYLLSVVMLSVFMPSGIILSVVLICVVVPFSKLLFIKGKSGSSGSSILSLQNLYKVKENGRTHLYVMQK
jgi:hypothetical protein